MNQARLLRLAQAEDFDPAESDLYFRYRDVYGWVLGAAGSFDHIVAGTDPRGGDPLDQLSAAEEHHGLEPWEESP